MTRDEPRWRIHLALVLAQVFFGLFPVFGKLAMRAVSPLALTLLRVVAAAAFLTLVAVRRGVPLGSLLGRNAGERWRLMWLGLLGVAANQLLFVSGLHLTTVVEATIVLSTIPVLTFLFAVLLGHEAAEPRRLLGIALAFTGMIALVGGGIDSAHLLGDALILANVTCYSLYLVLSRQPLLARGAVTTLAGAFLWGALLALPFTAYTSWRTPWTELPLSVWGSLAFIVVFPTIGSYGLTAYTLGRAPASLVSAYVYLQPILAVGSAMIVLGEQPAAGRAMALLLVLLGTLLATRWSREPVTLSP